MIYNMIKQAILIVLFIQLSLSACPNQGVDTSINFIQNGDFQTPVVGIGNPPLIFPGGVAGWTASLAEIGNGDYYNTNWVTGQVGALDTGVNQGYKQTFNFQNAGDRFFFSLDFARHMGSDPNSNGVRVFWNGQNVANYPTSNDDMIYQILLNLTSIQGVNTVIIQALGKDDGIGTEIDNVKMNPIVTYNRQMINGVCSCSVGYFDNGHDYSCVGCSQMMPYCIQCSFVPDLSLLTPQCLSNTYSGLNCSFGSFTCTMCDSGYYIAQDGTCQIIQTDPNFYKPNWHLQYVNCNKFKADISVELTSFSYIFNITTNNTNIIVNNYQLNQGAASNFYSINLECSYTNSIAQQTVSFIITYQDQMNTIQTQASTIDMKFSDAPLVLYEETECIQSQNIQGFATAIVVISYIILFFSLISLKIVGLQLFGVLQLAFLDLASQDTVNLYLRPLLKWKYIHGLNIDTTQQFGNIPITINSMGYKDNFFFNFNFMFAVLAVDLIIGSILYCVARRKLNKKMEKISLYIMKIVFITLFLFNSLNLSFCIGIHFKYADPQKTQLYGLGTIGALLGIAMYIFAGFYMQLVKTSEFGEFKNKFKLNCVNRLYIPITILYRFILGLYISAQNQWYLGTLLIIAVSIVFIMYNVVNLPFKRAYQNYRANMCHFIQLIILLVSNYYRSMKHNTSMNQRGKIFWPAILELVFIFFCAIISMICLVYEIVTAFKAYMAKKKTKESQQGQVESKMITNVLDFIAHQQSKENINNDSSNQNQRKKEHNITQNQINIDNP